MEDGIQESLGIFLSSTKLQNTEHIVRRNIYMEEEEEDEEDKKTKKNIDVLSF